jgi:hypothetical protein
VGGGGITSVTWDPIEGRKLLEVVRALDREHDSSNDLRAGEERLLLADPEGTRGLGDPLEAALDSVAHQAQALHRFRMKVLDELVWGAANAFHRKDLANMRERVAHARRLLCRGLEMSATRIVNRTRKENDAR